MPGPSRRQAETGQEGKSINVRIRSYSESKKTGGAAVGFAGTHEDSCYVRLSFFLLLGTFFGTVFCNGISAEMKEELGILESSLVSASVLSRTELSGLFSVVLMRRIPELLFLFLAELTCIAPVLLAGAAAWLGFSTAVMVCMTTMETGIAGIFRYALLIFPQCLFYIPVIYVLFLWIPSERQRLKPAAAAALSGLVLAGAAAETWLNPRILSLFL